MTQAGTAASTPKWTFRMKKITTILMPVGCIYTSNVRHSKDVRSNFKTNNWRMIFCIFSANQTGFATDVSLNLFPLLGRSMTLPCRPTSPDLHVVLLKDGLVKNTSVLIVWFKPKKRIELKQFITFSGYRYTEQSKSVL